MTHKSNNVIPNGHFHKKWQRRIRTWFNQPAKKLRRRMNRKKKALSIAPRPLRKLRPTVRCPSLKHHTRVRLGRGFTLEEVKRSGLSVAFARSIGIPVDHRRLNKSYESLATNVQTLKEYLARLILFPMRKSQLGTGGKLKKISVLTEATEEQRSLAVQLTGKTIIPPKDPVIKLKARVPTEEEKKFSAYATLRKARIDALLLGKRAKRAREKMENQDVIPTGKGEKKSKM